MAVSDGDLAFVLDQLAGLGDLRAKRMFGGVGLYCGERFFALIDDGVLYLKVDDLTRARYTRRRLKPFSPGGMFEVDEGAIRPEPLSEFLARDEIARPLQQRRQDLEGLFLQMDLSARLPQLA